MPTGATPGRANAVSTEIGIDGQRFDDLARALAANASRRRVLRGAVGGVLASLVDGVGRGRAGVEPGTPFGRVCRSGNVCATPGAACRCYGNGHCRCLCPAGAAFVGGACRCPDGEVSCGRACAGADCDANADCCSGVCVAGVCRVACGEFSGPCDDRDDCCDADLICDAGFCEFACFVGGTRVAMADGSSKAIALIEGGDLVLGQAGGTNRVRRIARPTLGPKPLYALNGGPFFVTAGHPFFTDDGWKAIDPAATAAEHPGLAVGRLAIGDRMRTLAAVRVPALIGGPATDDGIKVRLAPVLLRSIVGRAADPTTPIYNLTVDGDHTYFADDLLVHNKT